MQRSKMLNWFSFALVVLATASATRPAAAVNDLFWYLTKVESDFTGPFNPEPADIFSLTVSSFGGQFEAPIFSLDLVITSTEFTQVAGGPVIQPRTGLTKIAGVIDAADTYFSVPETIDPGDILVAPGTSIDDSTALAAAFTVVGNTPIIREGDLTAVIATLAVPAGTTPNLRAILGTAIYRTGNGPVAALVYRDPEPSTAILVLSAAIGAVGWRRRA